MKRLTTQLFPRLKKGEWFHLSWFLFLWFPLSSKGCSYSKCLSLSMWLNKENHPRLYYSHVQQMHWDSYSGQLQKLGILSWKQLHLMQVLDFNVMLSVQMGWSEERIPQRQKQMNKIMAWRYLNREIKLQNKQFYYKRIIKEWSH